MSRVLLVEDDDLVARAFARMLRGHEVHRVSSRVAARAAIAREMWDVIVFDLSMAGPPAELIGRLPVHAAQAVLWVTGAQLGDDRVVAAKATGRPVAQKPIAPAALRAFVEAVAARRL